MLRNEQGKGPLEVGAHDQLRPAGLFLADKLLQLVEGQCLIQI